MMNGFQQEIEVDIMLAWSHENQTNSMTPRERGKKHPLSFCFNLPPSLSQVCVYVDLHGHSRKHNVFMYGCHTPKADHTQFLYERLLPFLLSEQVDHDPRSIPLIKFFFAQAADMFCLASCKFAVQRCKESTGRVVTWRSGVPNSFTLEATFCGSNLGPNRYGTSL